MRALSNVAFVVFCILQTLPASAAEGSSAAGPIGGNDIRSALLPPPGFYAGSIEGNFHSHDFSDGHGNAVSSLDALDLSRSAVAPFILFVPKIQFYGGTIGFAAVFPGGRSCGRLFASTPRGCISGLADPYVEAGWSRFLGKIRASTDPAALPIPEGLSLYVGVGAVIPVGTYGAQTASGQGLTLGNNVWDFAPAAAASYTTGPWLADGTEIGAKIYWNNYLSNPDTHYRTGSIVNVDFAVTEHIGPVQLGLAGSYGIQLEDDRLFGESVPPDGRRGEFLSLGGVLGYDLVDLGTSLKIKFLSTVLTRNSVDAESLTVGWVKKF